VPLLDVGDPVMVRINSLGARGLLQGQITRTAYALDPQDRTLRAEIALPNTDGRLRPGQMGRVTINLETRENVLTIPSSAIVERNDLGKAVCYRVEGGRAVRAILLVGPDDGLRVEVLYGLKEGDTVITKPDTRISDGQAVTIRREGHEPAAR
jgi:membrane fusion protein (multidrug efflux system)